MEILAIVLVVAIIAAFVAVILALIVTKLYRKVAQGQALVISKTRSIDVTFTGSLVVPVIL